MVGTANAQTTTNNYKVAGNANTVFTDVPKDHWSKDAIDYLAAAGLFERIWKWKIWFWGSYY